jgi:hypothetical protein
MEAMKINSQSFKQPEAIQPKSEKQASVDTILSEYGNSIQRKAIGEEEPLQKKANNTGLPDNLKSGVENLSGYAMDDVKVHYNSSEPAGMQAHAYAQGTDIHIGPGQEKHLPHEAWHVVQQKQGRVKATMQMKGKVNINDDTGLETEADVMGAKAISAKADKIPSVSLQLKALNNYNNPVQRVLTIDNGDFSGVNEIKKIGGNAEGAFLVSDGPGKIVIKAANGIDSTVMAYNLAKDFGVATPKGRYMDLATPSGIILKAKASTFCKTLSAQLDKAAGITIWSLVDGDTIDNYKHDISGSGKDNGSKAGAEKESQFEQDPRNFEEVGRMFIYDAAILNMDRFKLEFGNNTAMNPGNLMVEKGRTVAIDQDFANVDKDNSKPNSQLDDYKGSMGRMIEMLKNPQALAASLCDKLATVDKLLAFKGKEAYVKRGLEQGLAILSELANDKNPRLDNLIAWTKTFRADTDLDAANIKEYWKSLLPKVKE